MRAYVTEAIRQAAGAAMGVFLLASGTALASTVALTASPTTATLPDGQIIPMWGYTCGAVSANATCTAANGVAQSGTGWQPPLITVPSGEALTITLSNQLSFATPGGATNAVPTSLTIVGQIGGGLGAAPTRVPSPTHAPQGTTWPGTAGTTNPGDPVFVPPAQADRVQSFGTEVAPGGSQTLTWSNL